MGRNLVNLSQPETRQIWQHLRTGIHLLIADVDNDWAVCVVLNELQTATKLQVAVPLYKFKCYGNRGLRLVGKRTTAMPKARPWDLIPEYNPRLVNLGAQ